MLDSLKGNLHPGDLPTENMPESATSMDVIHNAASPALRRDAKLHKSSIKNLLKRGIGALFLVFGLWTALCGGFPASSAERVLAQLLVAFLILGGAWWLAGKAEPYLISMKARLALIFGLLVLILCPSITLYTTAAFDAKTGVVVGAVTYTLLGLPALVLGHAARRTVANSAFLRGSGRAAVALLFGYVCLCAIGWDAVTTFKLLPVEGGIVREPRTTNATDVKATPLVPQPSSPPTNPSDALGVAWIEQEHGRWRGTWTRRGLSNIFDAALRNGDHEETKTFVAFVSCKDGAVHVDASDSSDGKNSVYDGTMAADGKTIQGTYTCNGGRYPFAASIVPLDHSYAEDGTYFLLDYRSVRTKSGIVGFSPGTQVKRLQDRGGTMLVGAQSYEFEVKPEQVTSDLGIARQLAASDEREQAALSVQASKEQSRVAQAKLAERQREEANRQKQVAVAQQPSARYVSPLERGSYGQTSSSSGRNGWMQGVTITKAQSERLLNALLDHANAEASSGTSIDLAPLPLLHSDMDVRRARDRVQSETARTDISRSDYNRLVERLRQLGTLPVGGPNYLESPYRGYEQAP